MDTARGPLRIGEFARCVGVSPDLLRAWERRYGLLQPVRSSGGFRLYTDEDAERVARMRRALTGARPRLRPLAPRSSSSSETVIAP